ncbi:MAG: hypothetical protein MMC33_008684 [Icmadophila ericetorum]|nr:hypothetical protein [Icmadophila ericetorum]
MRSFAHGTFDYWSSVNKNLELGVSVTTWHGSSGGPCCVLNGDLGGKVVGLIQEYKLIDDPFNIINSFPPGLKAYLGTLKL